MTGTAPQPGTAAAAFCDVWCSDLAADLAVALNCTELDALADLLISFDRAESAAIWLDHHQAEDEPGDAHHPDTDPLPWVNGHGLRVAHLTTEQLHNEGDERFFYDARETTEWKAAAR